MAAFALNLPAKKLSETSEISEMAEGRLREMGCEISEMVSLRFDGEAGEFQTELEIPALCLIW
jgi:hypothetical protein